MSGLRRLLPSANSLLVFESAARTLSFKAAADELRMTQPSVSHAIKTLENHLGVRLFERGNRGVQLTPTGAEIYAEVGPALTRVEAKLKSVSERDANSLTVAASTSVAAQWLLPLTARFQHTNSALKIKLMTTDRNVEPDGDVDLTIRRGPINWERQNCWYLTDEVLYPICSQAYFSNSPPLNSVQDLKNHAIIHNAEPYRDRMSWKEWLAALNVTNVDLPESLTLSDYQLVLQACIAGEGIGLGWTITSKTLIEEKVLICPLSQTVKTGYAFFLLGPKSFPLSRSKLDFVEWIVSQFQT